jgi:hypothetical protein
MIATTITEKIYIQAAAVTNFPIVFNFTDNADVKLYLDDVPTAVVFDNVLNPLEVVIIPAPAIGVEIKIKRETVKVQPTDLEDDVNEDQLDRIVQMVQEIEVPAAAPVAETSPSIITDWTTNTDYVKGELLYHTGNEKHYKVLVDHTSDGVSINADIMVNYIEEFNQGEQGVQGIQGDQGLQGPAGNDGANGLNGAQGANGVFAEIASQAEAEAGVNNTKGMTPLRFVQALAAQIGAYINPIINSVAALTVLVGQNKTEIDLLKQNFGDSYGLYSGSQKIGDNVGPLDLSADSGSPLLFNANGTELVNVEFYVRRGVERFSSFGVTLQYVDGTWYISRKETFVLNEVLEMDGFTLSLVQVGPEVQLQYTTDALAGAFVEAENYVAWQAKEFPITILP